MTNATANLLYSKEHEWVLKLDGNRVRIGITDYAQKALGDIVFVENPSVDDDVTANESMGTIESVKAVSELFSPVSGTVVTVNENLEDAPETINEHPYDAGWLVEVEVSNLEDLESLLKEEEYEAFINEGEE
ncbi:glycine cleavage system protein GcvH [Metabacillus sediminilitoris]|uniref:Glycine cleavage system H protein n=1 Tax=Metabacillus sediminilitoris TaxID=2567941 RepID=A0A4S4BZ58_9BACI|nr:glycine cleavage system protein GcvH [Metabacillus sediminilitoris]QGQ44865.1 glycine cleavage system protein GcvH [Metabacillus sediminilitoris]THF78498.1 glycine cleavage system protein GcvH [Metabacillus sediminilitoris]